jgi:large subunit ribosomal protein L29
MKKTTELKQLRDLAPQELGDRETELAERLFTYRIQKVIGQLEKPSKVREARRGMARVLTVLREKNEKNEKKGAGAA